MLALLPCPGEGVTMSAVPPLLALSEGRSARPRKAPEPHPRELALQSECREAFA